MLIHRSELSFDFGTARFDLSRRLDREFLGWVFNQFLYGEVTGIQCGHWLYQAPHLNAAAFLARQAGEELAHVRKILRILALIGASPVPAHPVIRYLSTGMMGGSWGEHVALEMALGEGLVLSAFYALADTIEDSEIKKLLESAIADEERHVAFGERETASWLEAHPEDRSFLLAQAFLQAFALGKLRRYFRRKLLKGEAATHPVLSQFDGFYGHVLRGLEARVHRLGLSPLALSELPAWRRWGLLVSIPGRKLARSFRRRKLLTSTYLQDPVVLAEMSRESRPGPR